MRRVHRPRNMPQCRWRDPAKTRETSARSSFVAQSLNRSVHRLSHSFVGVGGTGRSHQFNLTVRHFTEQTNGNSRGHSQPSDRYRVTLYRLPIRCAWCPQTSHQSGFCYTPFVLARWNLLSRRPDVSTCRALVVEDLGRLRPLQARDKLRAPTERAAGDFLVRQACHEALPRRVPGGRTGRQTHEGPHSGGPHVERAMTKLGYDTLRWRQQRPAMPARPRPRRVSEAGSGTGAVDASLECHPIPRMTGFVQNRTRGWWTCRPRQTLSRRACSRTVRH